MDGTFRKCMEAAEELAALVLGPYEARPAREDLDVLVSNLVRLGLPLATTVAAVPATERSPLAAGALRDWTYATQAGAADSGDHALWNHARGLARVLGSLADGIREHQPTSVL
ncbi:hypothetical protein [Streptomyces sp. NPDC091268]|uniref:hypothetical protein n=1 Tax=Streptomyces sp. NPDC091268 TaxID=3365979 RepID=UPI00382644CA